MKVVTTLAGSCVVCASTDDVTPPRGIIGTDLINVIRSRYEFQISPVVRPNIALPPILTFQNGVYRPGKVQITQLNIAPDGDGVVSQNTDLAETVISDYIDLLNNEFEYRYTGKEPKLYYSVVVVEFAVDFAKRMSAIQEIQTIISDTIKNAEPYRLKTLTFAADANETVNQNSIRQLILPDFAIDRRANSSFDQNRFYCAAPLSTSEHLRVLEQIERIVLEAK